MGGLASRLAWLATGPATPRTLLPPRRSACPAFHSFLARPPQFCVKAKRVLDAFKSSGLDYKVIELDQRRDGSQIQSALAAVTGQRTVPNVFVNGKSIGGGDETAYLHSSGKLRELLVECGAISA